MTVRWIGGGVLFAGGFLVRRALLRAAGEERETLRDLIALCRRMDREITLCLTPMARLLALPDLPDAASAFFRSVQEGIQRGGRLGEQWRTAASALSVREPAKSAFASLGEQLTGDAETAHRALSSTVEALSQSLNEREASRADETKLTTACCLGVTSLIFLLLI